MGSINLEGVRKVFGDGTIAVKDVSLQIEGGEFVVFVGPSGCGKVDAAADDRRARAHIRAARSRSMAG